MQLEDKKQKRAKKATHIRELGLTHFVDDRAVTCNLLAQEADITPIIYEQPWNFGKHTLSSVSNWQSIRGLMALFNE